MVGLHPTALLTGKEGGAFHLPLNNVGRDPLELPYFSRPRWECAPEVDVHLSGQRQELEMTHVVKDLPHKHDNLNLNPQHPHKKADVVASP